MAEIFNDSVRKEVSRNLYFAPKSLLFVISDYCAKQSTSSCKLYKEEMLYFILTCIDMTQVIKRITTIHPMHLKIILNDINTEINAIINVCLGLRINPVKRRELLRLYYAETVKLYIAILRCTNETTLLEQANYFIEDASDLEYGWGAEPLVLNDSAKEEIKKYMQIYRSDLRSLKNTIVFNSAISSMTDIEYVRWTDLFDNIKVGDDTTLLSRYLSRVLKKCVPNSRIRTSITERLNAQIDQIEERKNTVNIKVEGDYIAGDKNVEAEIQDVHPGGIGAQITPKNNQ